MTLRHDRSQESTDDPNSARRPDMVKEGQEHVQLCWGFGFLCEKYQQSRFFRKNVNRGASTKQTDRQTAVAAIVLSILDDH